MLRILQNFLLPNSGHGRSTDPAPTRAEPSWPPEKKTFFTERIYFQHFVHHFQRKKIKNAEYYKRFRFESWHAAFCFRNHFEFRFYTFWILENAKNFTDRADPEPTPSRPPENVQTLFFTERRFVQHFVNHFHREEWKTINETKSAFYNCKMKKWSICK